MPKKLQLPSFQSETNGSLWNKETKLEIYGPEINWPKISVVTPSFNQGRFIEKTIRSVLLQNYPNLEFIILDGGSKDESVEIIKKYDQWIDYWVSEKDNGQADAISRGLNRASGEILTWLNTDDYYLPNALYHVANAYLSEKEKGIDVWVGQADKIDQDGRLIYHAAPPELTKESFLHWRNDHRPPNTGYFLQPACFFTREAWEQTGPLKSDLYICLDVDLWLRMVENFKFSPIQKKLAIAVGHKNAKTTAEIEISIAETALVISEHGGRHIAQQDLMRLVEEHIELKRKWRKIITSAPYRFYKNIKTLLKA